MTDIQLSDVRKVTLYYIGTTPSSFLIPAAEVDRFVDASKRLHWKPGRNPHNGCEASKVYQITVGTMEARGPFWWTTPDLQNNGDPAGARIIDVGTERTVWVDDEYIARCEAEQAESEARHWRAKERKARQRTHSSTQRTGE